MAAHIGLRKTAQLAMLQGIQLQRNIRLQRHYGNFEKFYEFARRQFLDSSLKNTSRIISKPYSAKNSKSLVEISESKRFMIDCFKACKVPEDHAIQMADLLVEADCRGHFSHGMNRLEMYIDDLLDNTTDGSAKPKVLKESVATAWVDGCNGLGAVVGNFCIDLAIAKAKSVGVGWVCANNCNHYGMAGWYSMRAMEQHMVGLSMTNTSPLMAPTRSKEAVLGTNPLSFGARALGDDIFLLDMATTAVAVGKIEMQLRKNEPIPDGWAQDPDGNITTDAELAFNTGCLTPLGGQEIFSGYKGYGLGGLVDILTGVMSGAKHSKQIRKWKDPSDGKPANLGQVFIAINPNFFAPNFESRMKDFNSTLRSCAPTDPKIPVLLPGDKEAESIKITKEKGGIEYLPNQLESCANLATKLNIKSMNLIC